MYDMLNRPYVVEDCIVDCLSFYGGCLFLASLGGTTIEV